MTGLGSPGRQAMIEVFWAMSPASIGGRDQRGARFPLLDTRPLLALRAALVGGRTAHRDRTGSLVGEGVEPRYGPRQLSSSTAPHTCWAGAVLVHDSKHPGGSLQTALPRLEGPAATLLARLSRQRQAKEGEA